MRQILQSITKPQSERGALIGDALGALALFVLAYAALHLPIVA